MHREVLGSVRLHMHNADAERALPPVVKPMQWPQLMQRRVLPRRWHGSGATARHASVSGAHLEKQQLLCRDSLRRRQAAATHHGDGQGSRRRARGALRVWAGVRYRRVAASQGELHRCGA